jgi:uncharacterized membrane protein YbhN (UPF0104 family)
VARPPRAPAAPPLSGGRAGAAPARRRPRPAGVVLGVGVLALAAWVLTRMIATVGWPELLRRLATADLRFVALAAAGVAAHFAAWAARWRVAVLAARARIGFGYLYLAIFAAAAVNLATPFARVFGGLLRARYLARRDAERRGGAALYGVVLFDQLVHLTVMSTGTVLVLMLGATRLGNRTLTVAALALAAVIALVALAARRAGAPGRLSRRYAVRLGQETWSTLAQLLARPRVIAAALLLGVVVVLLQSSAQAAAFLAVGVRPPLLVVIASVLLGAAAGSVSGSPGGVGATEAAMIGIYVSQGISPGDAAAAALLYRGTHYVMVLALGLPAAAALEVQIARTARGEA